MAAGSNGTVGSGAPGSPRGIPVGEAIAVPADATVQASYSGTPRMADGTSQPDEYVSELRNPLLRMEKFEEMGASDDGVYTAIQARRQEIGAANWALASSDTTPAGTEILEFVEDNLYPLLDDLLRWLAGGALQYGFGAVEPVFQWSDQPLVGAISRGKVTRATKSGSGRRIYLAKLAHLRQTSVYTFKIEQTGDLFAIQQHVFDGQQFRMNDIPAEKILKWTYDRQGDDHWGVPPTRHCYKAWTFKSQLEKLNILHVDKFGVGTPVAEEGEGWQESDRQKLAGYLKAWRSGAANYILHPSGGSIEIMTDEGKMSLNILEWVKYYNIAIAKTYLTQMTELGTTETGTRALGETMYEQLQGIVQSDCEDLANIINNSLIVPLVRWNFGVQETYPVFAPTQRVLAGTGIGQVLAQLAGAGAIHFRPEDEAYLRDAIGLPDVELKVLQSEQDERDATPPPAPNTDPNTDPIADPNAAPAKPGDPTAPPIGEKKQPAPPKRIAAARAHHRVRRQLAGMADLSDGAPPPATPGDTTYRTPGYSAWEHGVLRPDVLGRDLDLAETRAAGEVQDVLRQIDDALTEQVNALALKGAAALSAGVRSIACPDSLRAQLRQVILAAAERARDYGASSVANEIERQGGPGAIGPQRAPSFARAAARAARMLAAAADKSPQDLHLLAEVDGAVEDEIDRREQSARSAALIALSQAAGADASTLASVASAAIKDALLSLSTGRTAQNVGSALNVGFGIGRSETAQQIASGSGDGGNRSGLTDSTGAPIDLTSKVYSAVMDDGTCDECAKWDGAEFPIDYPEDFTGVQAPNPRCAGGTGQCRCVWIYVTSRENVPLVPTSKGPLPIRGAA